MWKNIDEITEKIPKLLLNSFKIPPCIYSIIDEKICERTSDTPKFRTFEDKRVSKRIMNMIESNMINFPGSIYQKQTNSLLPFPYADKILKT